MKTPGPWRVIRWSGHSMNTIVADTDPAEPTMLGSQVVTQHGHTVITSCEGSLRDVGNEANAARIVDCVNACDGMEFPDVEIATMRSHIERLRAAGAALTVKVLTAEQQRDELLAHLKHAVHWFDQLRKPDADRYRAAIEKVERAATPSIPKAT